MPKPDQLIGAMDLKKLRKKIDSIDKEIIDRLNDRVDLACQIGRIKMKAGDEIYVPSREEEVFQKLAAESRGPLNEKAIRAIYRQVMSAATALQKKIVVAYLGPEATFTQQAAQNNFGSSAEYQSLGNIADVFAAVQRAEADYGVVPIENSTEGAVFHSLDMLIETDLKIVAQVYLEVSLCLISQSPLKKIKSVHSKDNALGQCRQWLGRMLPDVTLVECESTALAVQHARDNSETAAIAGNNAAELYKVPVVSENIQDKSDNITRFLAIGKDSNGRLGKGRDKTSYVFSLRDEVGALVRVLEAFSSRDINLCKIESRPSRRKLWDYYFFVDIIGHCEDKPVREAIDELKKSCPVVKWLGSYPNT